MPIIADTSAAEGPTFGELITEVTAGVQGYGLAPDRILALEANLTDSALTFVAQGAGGPGVYEIGSELIYVSAVDSGTGTCTVHPHGRGWQGSTAAAHAAGSVVTESPVFPRIRVASAINDIISSLYPVVFAIGATTAPVTQTMFELPTDAEAVLEVRALDDDGEWVRVRTWEAERQSGAVVSTKAVYIPTVQLGTTVQVLYSIRPERFATEDQEWSITGLTISMKDVVVIGALVRFVQTLDIGRFTDRFVGPRGDNEQPQLGAGFAMARQIRADYQAALDREALALRTLYPARAHFTR